MIDIAQIQKDWQNPAILTTDICLKHHLHYHRLIKLANAHGWPARDVSLAREKNKPLRLMRQGDPSKIPRLPSMAMELKRMRKEARAIAVTLNV